MQQVQKVEVLCNTVSKRKCEFCGKSFIPHYDSKIKVVVPDCNCFEENQKKKQEEAELRFKQKKLTEYYSLAELGSKFMKRTFENWRQRPGTEKAYQAAIKLSDSDKSPQGLFLIGVPGNGKTHLVAAMTHRLIERGKTVIFWDINEFLDKINYCEQSHKYYISKVLRHIRKADWVILNDLGKENYTPAKESTIFKILDTVDKWEKNLAVTMNPVASKKMDESEHLRAVLDRIRGICKPNIIEVTASSDR